MVGIPSIASHARLLFVATFVFTAWWINENKQNSIENYLQAFNTTNQTIKQRFGFNPLEQVYDLVLQHKEETYMALYFGTYFCAA